MYKVCLKCGVEKEATRENFYRDSKGKLGLRPYCIECEKKRFTSGYNRGKAGNIEGNYYEIKDDYAIGYTRKNEQFILDIEDVELAKNYTWHLDRDGYIESTVRDEVSNKQYHEKLHRLLLGFKLNDGNVVDHINRNKLDNRKHNLRKVTVKQNSFNQGIPNHNKSGVVGVFYRKRKGRKPRWVASINIDGKTKQIGQFDTKEEAIKARKQAEIEHYKGFRTQEG